MKGHSLVLHDDVNVEAAATPEATLHSPAFYIGALGSTPTRRHVKRLKAMAVRRDKIDHINVQIWMSSPTGIGNSLAQSFLTDIAVARLVAYA